MNCHFLRMLALVVACFSPIAVGQNSARAADSPATQPAAKPVVKVGSKMFTESIILGEIITRLANHAGAQAEHRRALGGTQIVFKALEKGEIDIYVDYTGTISQEILQGKNARTEADMRTALAKRGIVMGQHLGFNNSYAIGLKETLAAELNLTKISQLASRANEPAIAKLKFGFSEEFMGRKDGWDGLKAAYQLLQTPVALDHNVAYRGLESGILHVTDLYSTDPEVQSYHLRLLEDDLAYFPLYHAVILYRQDLAQRAPEVLTQILVAEGKISNPSMVEMNARVRIDHVKESLVAAEVLQRQLNIPITETAVSPWRELATDIGRNALQHLKLVLLSLTAAIAIALPLGIVAYKFSKLSPAIVGVVQVIQTLPSMAVLVSLVPILGLGAKPAIAALFLYSLLPIVRNTLSGLQQIPANLKESALALGLPSGPRLWLVELPMASRSILSGIKTAAVVNVGTATIGGLIGAGGFGEPILTGIRNDQPDLLLQGAIPVAILALLVQGFFTLLERWLVPAGLRIPAAS